MRSLRASMHSCATSHVVEPMTTEPKDGPLETRCTRCSMGWHPEMQLARQECVDGTDCQTRAVME